MLILLGWGAIIGLVCGIIAIVLAKKIKEESSEKETMAQVGFVCGIIGIILSALAIISLIVLMFVGKSIIDTNEKMLDKTVDATADAFNKMYEETEEIRDNMIETDDQSNNKNSEELINLQQELAKKEQELASKKDAIVDLQSRVSEAITNGQIDQLSGLQTEITNLNKEISDLTTEIFNLNNQIEALK